MRPISEVETRARKPSLEMLESVKLKPTYFSFPSPNAGRSPTIPSFRFPQYGYYSLHVETNAKLHESTAIPSPKSCISDHTNNNKRTTIMGTVVNFANYFVGVRTSCASWLCYLYHFLYLTISDWGAGSSLCTAFVRMVRPHWHCSAGNYDVLHCDPAGQMPVPLLTGFLP